MNNMMNLWTSGALRDILSKDNVNEVMINAPHNVFIETNGAMQRYDDVNKDFTLTYLMQVSTLVANYTKENIGEFNPILSATLNTGERIQIVTPPACDFSQYVLAIRKPAVHRYTLDDYNELGYFDLVNAASLKIEKNDEDELLKYYEKESDWLNFIKLAISSKKNIIVVGGTGSGKTTFANTLIDLINADERLITIEDAREVLTRESDKKRNVVNLLTSSGTKNRDAVTFSDLVKACLRLRPDRILLSELRGAEAFDFLNAINTGHNGSITSLHANSAKDVYSRLVTMIKMSDAGRGLSKDDIYDYCVNSIDVILHASKSSGRWYLKEIIYD